MSDGGTRLTPRFFENRAIFKPRLSDESGARLSIHIPRRERRVVGFEPRDDVEYAVSSPLLDEIYIGESQIEATGERIKLLDEHSRNLEEKVGKEKPVQAIVSKKETTTAISILRSMFAGYLYDRAVYKTKITKSGGSLAVTVPSTEGNVIGVEKGDSARVILIKLFEGSPKPLRKRSLFRANIFKSGGSGFRFTIPSVRERLKGYEHEQHVQVILRKKQ